MQFLGCRAFHIHVPATRMWQVTCAFKHSLEPAEQPADTLGPSQLGEGEVIWQGGRKEELLLFQPVPG